MSIAQAIQNRFSLSSRTKGENLWANGSLKIVEVPKGNSVEFRVFGGDVYRVRIVGEIPAKTLIVSCTCPHFAGGNACKHIWACLFECNIKSYLQGIELCEHLAMTDDTDFEDESDVVHDEVFRPRPRTPKVKVVRKISWQEKLKQVQKRKKELEPFNWARIENSKTASFLLDLPSSLREREIHLRFLAQEHLKSGKLGVLKPIEVRHSSISLFPDERDRRILQGLLGQTRLESGYGYYHFRGWPEVSIPNEYAEGFLLEMSQTQKLFLADGESHIYGRSLQKQPLPYSFSPEKWKTAIQVERKGPSYVLSASLKSSSQTRGPRDVIGIIERFVFFKDFMASSDLDQTEPWFNQLGRENLEIPENEFDSFLEIYLRDARAPELVLPPDLQFREEKNCVPRVRLQFSNSDTPGLIGCRMFFVYEDEAIDANSPAAHAYSVPKKKLLHRNSEFENAARQQFAGLGLLPANLIRSEVEAHGYFYRDDFVAAAEKGLSWNWEVIADQKVLRSPGPLEFNVSSGVDWFELQAELNFQTQKILLPQLIAHIRSGSRLLTLDDGTLGILPEKWLQRLERLANTGSLTNNGIKLSKVQALFLSAEIGDNENFKADRKFRSLNHIVEELRNLKPEAAGKTFKGKLRAYQKEGLSWLNLISKHGIGGILADDMGLGKTVQILALLADVKADTPHLIVAPKSLIFNWIQESRRFTPHLRVLDFTGTKRSGRFEDHDLVLTTYQTLRSDIEKLSQQSFASLILDEAHHVKNPKSQAALACRMIKAPRKIALTGTPVENSLSDLFSILNIVNPGLLGENQIRSWSQEKDPEALDRIAKALRPFLLRRTKENVLKDLPPKSEQILYCELSHPERKRYDELRSFYWAQLNGKVKEKGLARSKIEVLEALLRLRQASCHHGLLDDRLRGKPSAKFELLLEQVESVIQDGRKALIFSQFTSLLGILKEQLDERGLRYEYLDGQTTDRQSRVEQFQANADIKLFLLSLKAGGVGLNLTAADYVFILDPWWNPAAESQAIDRTHRIGQTKKVFAYKIIAKGTVEEKILELQKNKKALAQAIVSDEKSVLKNLTMADLQALFS